MDSVLQRLEDVTGKLEKIYSKQDTGNTTNAPSIQQPTRQLPDQTPSSATDQLQKIAPRSRTSSQSQQAAPKATASSKKNLLDVQLEAGPRYSSMVQQYKSSCTPYLEVILKNAKIMGGSVDEITSDMAICFEVMLQAIKASEACKKPDPLVLRDGVFPLIATLEKAEKLGKDRKNHFYVNCLVIYEALQSFNWLFYSPTQPGMDRPENFIQQQWSSAEFQNNKILKQNKGSNQFQYEWAAATKDLFRSFKVLVGKNFPDGLAWNTQGQDLAQILGGGQTPAQKAGDDKIDTAPQVNQNGIDSESETHKPNAQGGLAGLFGELKDRKGGLQHVPKEVRNKNKPESDQPRTYQQKEKTEGIAKKEAKPMGEPKSELVEGGRRYIVENQMGNSNIVVESTGRHLMVVIINCSKSVVSIKGKVNVVSIEGCKNFGCVMEDVVASCEVTRSSDIKVQATGQIPNIQVELTNICNLYLSEKSLATEIITSQSSTINVCVPQDDDYRELIIPQQFRTFLKNGGLVTEPVTYSGE